MNKIKAIVVDDEAHARELIKSVLELFDSKIEIVGEAADLPEAVQKIQELSPQVVFMDINMPKYSGLQIHDFFKGNKFKLVFITAHDHHVVDALRIKAFDYLVKPIDVEQLQACVARIEKEEFIENETNTYINRSKNTHLEVHSLQGINYVPLAAIYYFEASAMYTIVNTENDQIIISKPLRDFAYLNNAGFYRVHRSFMVNTSKIKRFIRVESNEVEMVNGMTVPVSRSNKIGFIDYMAKL